MPLYRSAWAFLPAFAALVIFLPQDANAGGRFNLTEARKSVVFVRRLTPGLAPVVGSGFLVSEDGLIFTNRHVALPDEDARGSVVLVGVPSAKDPDVLEYYRAELVLSPPARDGLDFAALRIAGRDGAKFAALPLSFEKLGLGVDVAVVGYPHVNDGEPTLAVNKGSVSATKVKLDDRTYYQTDAAVNAGNSGGPLLNEAGEAAGIVTLKKRDADNIGFALHLAEVNAAFTKAKELSANVKPRPGPLVGKEMPAPAAIAPKADNWEVIQGETREIRGALIVEDNGAPYWLASKEKLPEDFQLVIRCQVTFLKGGQVLQQSQRSILRTVCIRFATDDTKTSILSPVGNHIKFSHEFLLFSKEKEVVKSAAKGNTDEPCTIVVTKKGGDYSFALDGETLLKWHDDKPLKAGTKFCIGGYLSRMALGEVSVIDLADEKHEKGKD